MPYAHRKSRYAIWDGTNVEEIAEFVGGAYADGERLYTSSFGNQLLAEKLGAYVVWSYQVGGWEVYANEAEFLAAYAPIDDAAPATDTPAAEPPADTSNEPA